MHQYTLEPVKVDIRAKLSESIQSTDKIQSPFSVCHLTFGWIASLPFPRAGAFL